MSTESLSLPDLLRRVDPHDTDETIKALNAAAHELERLAPLRQWERLFEAWVKHQAGLPSDVPLWPNPEWSQDVALIAHALASTTAQPPGARIHAICKIVREATWAGIDESRAVCHDCPAVEQTVYGPARRGCYMLAFRLFSLAVQGDPKGA